MLKDFLMQIINLYNDAKLLLRDFLFVLFFFVSSVFVTLLVTPILLIFVLFAAPGLLFGAIKNLRNHQDRMVFFEPCRLDANEYRKLDVEDALKKANEKFCSTKAGQSYSDVIARSHKVVMENRLADLLTHEFIKVGSKELHIVRSKILDPTKKTIIAFHGNCGSNFNYAAAMAPLAKRYNLIIPEYKGYGVMSGDGRSLPRIRDIEYHLGLLSDALFSKKFSKYSIDASNTVVIGYSLGSKVASSFVRQSEERHGVRFNNVAFLTTFDSVMNVLFVKYGLFSSSGRKDLWTRLLYVLGFLLRFVLSNVSNWSEDDALKIKSPISILHGLSDTTIPWQNAFMLADNLAVERLSERQNKIGSQEAGGVKIMLSSSDDHFSIVDLFTKDEENVIRPPENGAFEVGFYANDIDNRLSYYPACYAGGALFVDGMSEAAHAKVSSCIRSIPGRAVVNSNAQEYPGFISTEAIRNHTTPTTSVICH